MRSVRAVGCALVILGANSGCSVDVSGISDGWQPDASAPVDAQRPPAPDLGMDPPDFGSEELPDLGSPPDLVDCTPSAETCDGKDEDCDGAVDEDLSSDPCDGDGDGCRDGRTLCSSGALLCEGDGATVVGAACDGLDADSVAEGSFACEDDALTCPDDCIPAEEECNQRDDDCDGFADEDGVCSDERDDCRTVQRGDALYLFCVDAGGETWGGAVGECARGGYVLARVDDEAERAFLAMEAGFGNWWVGARTDRSDRRGRQNTDNWSWRPGEGSVDPNLWDTNEPSGDGSCAHIGSGFDGRMNDNRCDARFDYICEGMVLP